jgi:CRP/FNR family transcriptional regulator, cyclic AMP receptor protein
MACASDRTKIAKSWTIYVEMPCSASGTLQCVKTNATSGHSMKTENHIALKTAADLQQSIAEHPFFRAFPPERLSDIVRTAKEVAFTEGQVVFRETEPASRLFLITDGLVALESHVAPAPALVIQTIGADDVLGWSWLVAPYQWHFSARAVTPAKAIAIDAAHLLVACEKDPAFGYDLLKRVLKIVLERLQASRKRVAEAASSK